MVLRSAKRAGAWSGRVDGRNLWYAPHPRIRTASAARRAAEVAKVVAGPVPAHEAFNEQTLFVALHVCAFQALRAGQGGREALADRDCWIERWEAIRGHIVERNLGLVYSMIGRFGSRHVDEDDLLSEAMYALTRAVDRFNPWRGYRFSTYACNVIARAVMRRGKQESHYRQLFPVQHDVVFERDEGLPDTSAELYVERLHRILDRNLGGLTELESRVLSHRFPADDDSRLTFQQIGRAVGLSKERVRQIQNSAIDKLRALLVADPVLQ